ncbi:hypothetical protein GAO09_08835 [Rhizobiales bacterium RZME27]|uniref:Uncharacterized protein n=1 Tax=Endobacterium cereale TaxID=2663029 RepID=A0A6A8A4K7_9HYPH|nr:hypothetical protein [Endobacterium cereale]MEB2848169.1 hypothetical protein [Endobacterium cereale]MQY46155.1 hypothetical protein [Endobacterium cereale]
MRISALLAILATASPVVAKDPAIHVTQTDGVVHAFRGSSLKGDRVIYAITASDAGSIRFEFRGNNENCGAEIQTTSQLGYLPKLDRFPSERAFKTTDGETFALSFFQNRIARMNGVECAFSFSVE